MLGSINVGDVCLIAWQLAYTMRPALPTFQRFNDRTRHDFINSKRSVFAWISCLATGMEVMQLYTLLRPGLSADLMFGSPLGWKHFCGALPADKYTKATEISISNIMRIHSFRFPPRHSKLKERVIRYTHLVKYNLQLSRDL